MAVDNLTKTSAIITTDKAVAKFDTAARVYGCRAMDISITQKEVSVSKLPRYQVAITNTCIDNNCVLQNIVAACGEFTSWTPINPTVFRRDGAGPNCIVNNGMPVISGQSLMFTYDAEYLEPIHLASADPVCH